MKEIRISLSEEEYKTLRAKSDPLGLTVRQLIKDRALGITSENTPLCAVQILCNEVAEYRKLLNEIIRRETSVFPRLYEDDIIRLEMSMNGLEHVVAALISEIMRQVRNNGDT